MQIGKILLVSGLAAFITACAAPAEKRNWSMYGGSKADGNVMLGIYVPPKFGYTETPTTWDNDQAQAEADTRCRAWGYAGAAKYGGKLPVQETCHPEGFNPCWSKDYRVMFQCVGSK